MALILTFLKKSMRTTQSILSRLHKRNVSYVISCNISYVNMEMFVRGWLLKKKDIVLL